MAEEQHTSPDQDFPDSSDNASFGGEENINNTKGNNEQGEKNAQKEAKKDTCIHPNITVNVVNPIDSNEREETKKMNRWNKAGIIVNGALLLCTLAALFITYNSVKVSEKALAVADSTYRFSVHQDSINESRNFRLDAESDTLNERNRIKDSSTIAISQKSLQSQIQSIEETQRQFKALNQPFLQVTDITLMPLVANQPPEILFYLTNLSSIPVKIVGQRTTWSVRVAPEPINKLKSDLGKEINKTSFYVTKESPFDVKLAITNSVSDLHVNSLLYGKTYIYICKEYIYQNMVTGNYRKYFVYLRIKPIFGNKIFKNNTFCEFFYNDNFDDKPL